MKKLFAVLLVSVVAGIVFLSCRKGDAGIAGLNGASVLSGTGAPAAGLGTDGDFYLDTTTQILYGPKTSGGWGTGVELKGNANVIIDTFSVSNADWSYGAIYYIGTSPQVSTGFNCKSFSRDETDITQDLLNTGIVQAYYSSEPDLNANNWTALPYSFITYGGYQFNYAVETTVGKIIFYFYFNKISADPPDLQSYQMPELKFKVLMLPGKLIGEMTRRRQTGVAGNTN